MANTDQTTWTIQVSAGCRWCKVHFVLLRLIWLQPFLDMVFLCHEASTHNMMQWYWGKSDSSNEYLQIYFCGDRKIFIWIPLLSRVLDLYIEHSWFFQSQYEFRSMKWLRAVADRRQDHHSISWSDACVWYFPPLVSAYLASDFLLSLTLL